MRYKIECLYLPGLFVYNFRVNMASEHQPDAPSLKFSNDSDSDCYISDNESDDDYVSDQGYISGYE